MEDFEGKVRFRSVLDFYKQAFFLHSAVFGNESKEISSRGRKIKFVVDHERGQC